MSAAEGWSRGTPSPFLPQRPLLPWRGDSEVPRNKAGFSFHLRERFYSIDLTQVVIYSRRRFFSKDLDLVQLKALHKQPEVELRSVQKDQKNNRKKTHKKEKLQQRSA